MKPRSTSKFAANLVVDHSAEVVDQLVSDLERMLERHADFDRWLEKHSSCEVSRRPKDRCSCPLCTGAKS